MIQTNENMFTDRDDSWVGHCLDNQVLIYIKQCIMNKNKIWNSEIKEENYT